MKVYNVSTAPWTGCSTGWANLEGLPIVAKYIANLELMRRNGVYLYAHMDSFEQFNEKDGAETLTSHIY